MDGLEVVRRQFQMGHQFLDGTMEGISDEVLTSRGEGWTVNPIAAIYGHLVLSEDAMLQEMTRGVESVLSRDGWAAKLGIEHASPQQAADADVSNFNLATMREYAAAVAQETDSFLASAKLEELTREVETPMGTISAAEFVTGVPVIHLLEHWGEIAALKGVQGTKGLPF